MEGERHEADQAYRPQVADHLPHRRPSNVQSPGMRHARYEPCPQCEGDPAVCEHGGEWHAPARAYKAP